MRWEIKTKTEHNTEDKKEGDKTYKVESERKITTRSQYITIGDIVGMGKTAAGAVQKLSRQLPIFINKMKGMASSAKDAAKNTATNAAGAAANAAKAEATAASATAINYMVQPLLVVLNGMEKYKQIMNMIDMLTPIMKTIARTTGIWCSPGNVAEIGQIAMGMVNQILIGVLSSAVLKLKDFIWNYEFNIRDITDVGDLIEISRRLEEYNENSRGINVPSNVDPNLNEEFSTNNSKINGEGKTLLGDEYNNVKPDPEMLYEQLKNEGSEGSEGSKYKDDQKARYNYNGNNFQTEFPTENNNKRIFFGSLNNGGIWYSDDDRKTWTQSNKKDGSFAKFCKLKKGDKYIYIAGSTYIPETIKPTNDSKVGRDEENRYTKDYYSLNKKRLNRKEKDKILFNNFDYAKTTRAINDSDKKEKENSAGIWYSTDNGINWTQSEITTGRWEMFYDYKEKEGYPDRVVASSYDYEGIRYSDDGIIWHNSTMVDKSEITTGRWIFFTDSDGELANKILIKKIKGVGLVNANAGTLVNAGAYCKNNNFVTFKSKSLANLGYLNLDIVKEGIKYIHDNYPDKLIKCEVDWWDETIQGINNGTITIDNIDERMNKLDGGTQQ